MKKQQHVKKNLKLNKETIFRLAPPALQNIVGGTGSIDSCFPDICQDNESSAC